MKLLSYFLCAVTSEWTQPTYWDAVRDLTQRKSGWGHPVGVRAGASWENCPSLTLPDGVASVQCDAATCLAICEPGKVNLGTRRAKCRYKRSRGFFWRRALSACQGCNPEILTSTSANVNCVVGRKNIRTCTATCPNGDTLFGRNKLKLKCRCPRRLGTCHWFQGLEPMSADALTAGLTCNTFAPSSIPNLNINETITGTVINETMTNMTDSLPALSTDLTSTPDPALTANPLDITLAVVTDKPILTMPTMPSTLESNSTVGINTEKPVLTMPMIPADSNSTLAIETDKPLMEMPVMTETNSTTTGMIDNSTSIDNSTMGMQPAPSGISGPSNSTDMSSVSEPTLAEISMEMRSKIVQV